MNWDAVGAVGEIVGALAVVLSLIYLAVQIRHNTRTLRRSACRDAVASMRETNSRLIGNPAMTRIFLAGLDGSDELSAEDQAQFILVIFNFFKTYEDLHYQYLESGLDPAVWEGWARMGAEYLTAPGCRRYWEERRQFFHPNFQAWVDSLTPGGKHLGQLGENG